MKIDFNEIKEQHLEHFKGGEGAMDAHMYVDETGRILKGTLQPGCTIGLHKHEGSSETVYIVSGNGTMLYDGAEEALKAGDVSYCPEGHEHSLINSGTEPLVFIGVVPNL